MICPECEEIVINQKPVTGITPQMQWNGLPTWSHQDGEPLCPMIGDGGGYVPASPIEWY